MRGVRIEHHRHAAQGRHDLTEHLKPLSPAVFQLVAEARYVPARARQAGHEALAHRIGDDHDNGRGAGRPFGRPGRLRVGDQDHVHGDPKHFRDQFREALWSPARESLLDDDVLTLDPAKLAQALDECPPYRGPGRGRRSPDIRDP